MVGTDHRAARVESGEVREREARRFVADAKGWYLDVFDAIVRLFRGVPRFFKLHTLQFAVECAMMF